MRCLLVTPGKDGNLLSAYPCLVLALVILLPACSCTPSRENFTPKTTEIVKITTHSMAKVTLTGAGEQALEEFLGLEDVKNASDRGAIRAAWKSISVLDAAAPDFPDKAWQASEEDGDWPQGKTVPEKVYLDGFRQGIKSYVKGE